MQSKSNNDKAAALEVVDDDEVILKEGIDYEYDEVPPKRPAIRLHKSVAAQRSKHNKSAAKHRQPNATIVNKSVKSLMKVERRTLETSIDSNKNIEEVEVFVPNAGNQQRFGSRQRS